MSDWMKWIDDVAASAYEAQLLARGRGRCWCRGDSGCHCPDVFARRAAVPERPMDWSWMNGKEND